MVPNRENMPLIPASTQLPEFTFKAVVLSILLAVVLSAANAYLALKIGTTISASIPASVFALGILRLFKTHNVLESNLIQTAASAGEGIAAAIAFVLPAMIFFHIWKNFPYWETTIITLIGGLLGVLFAVPLRRVILNLPTLHFPEGTAIGNVLKMSVQGKSGVKLLAQGSLVGGLVTFAQMGLKIIADSVKMWIFIGKTIFGFSVGYTPAILAAGFIVGFEVSSSLFIGAIIGWLVLLPLIGLYYGLPIHATSAYDAATKLWDSHLRFVGVGTMLIGGVWTLLLLLKMIIKRMQFSFTDFRKSLKSIQKERLRTETDISPFWIIIGVAILAISLFFYTFYYLYQFHIVATTHYLWIISFASVVYVIIIGFLLATTSSYFCGLVGSSNNPLSGLLITAILLLSFLFSTIFRFFKTTQIHYIASSVIIIATVLAGIGSITGENIQDLKAGKMIGSTPWRQQLMMAVGVSASAFIIGPVLQLLFNAYGIGGIYPHEGMDPTQMLSAPQASLMAAVSQGVLDRHLNWEMIVVGGIIAVIIIVIDIFLKRRNFRLPALAVGLGIYLPPEVITPVIIGGFISFLIKKTRTIQNYSVKEMRVTKAYQNGILVACGMVAGSALMGVILAIPFVIIGSADALSLIGQGFSSMSSILGIIIFLLLCVWFYCIGIKKR
ncbi:OPT family oligopeptide transporter [Coxiella-like endosymbiont of Amblyomma americanum]|uniref:OPT family oligopeptide transporter n=1 Tax=Coxiella-like endosymbiont of Amblyomma americanum TaxID=1987500 RepID=UPI000F89EB12|nr:oligopeptide transporter, OPT family [Coxiella-like endosymbiont of Amblyomma americanum]AUJ58927.1 oligopeptide transporter, OPT family [Coxiella-like endosymbiont of Amblyomma americanum]